MPHPVPGSQTLVKTAIRKDIVELWGEQLETFLGAAQTHMADAMSTVLVLHERFHCLPCMMPRLMVDFFPWLNEEGHKMIVPEFDYSAFMREAVKWADAWARKQVANPCTDGMPSSRVH